jgi:sugar lactone lactonase YvrE
VAGTGEAGLGGDGGPAAEAMLNSPQDLTIGTDGSLYIADCSNHRVRRVDSQGKIMTVASVGGRPSGLAIGSEGRLYVTSRFDRQLKEVPTRHRVLLVWL